MPGIIVPRSAQKSERVEPLRYILGMGAHAPALPVKISIDHGVPLHRVAHRRAKPRVRPQHGPSRVGAVGRVEVVVPIRKRWDARVHGQEAFLELEDEGTVEGGERGAQVALVAAWVRRGVHVANDQVVVVNVWAGSISIG